MRSTSPTPMKQSTTVIISNDIKEASNEQLVAMMSHKTYDFCMNTPTIESSEKILQLLYDGLNRIFTFNNLDVVPQFKVYETIETLFDEQSIYDSIKALSSLKRLAHFGWPYDPEDTKYNTWMKNRVKFATRLICNKLNYITTQSRVSETV